MMRVENFLLAALSSSVVSLKRTISPIRIQWFSIVENKVICSSVSVRRMAAPAPV